MANKGGRPQDGVWEHFVRVTKDGKKLARCVSCGYEMTFPAGMYNIYVNKLPVIFVKKIMK